MKWKLLFITINLAVLLCACSMGPAIGVDGTVSLGDTAQTPAPAETVETPEAQAPAQTTPEDAAPVAGPPADEGPAQEEEIDVTGLQELEPTEAPEDNPFSQLETQTEAPAQGLTAEFDTPAENETLEQALAELEDEAVAQELEAYFAEKSDQASAAGLRETITVVYDDGPVLSVRRLLSGEGDTLRAETFQTQTGGRFTVGDFFPDLDASEVKALLTDKVTLQLEQSGRSFYDGWQSAVVTGFNPDQFYLSGEGLVVYYQAGELSSAVEEVTIPYGDLHGSLMLPG